jgi:hypothetical protein
MERTHSQPAHFAEPESYDWNQIVDDLNRLLRLRTTPIGMKLFATVEEMEQIPKLRRPKSIHTTDQIVAQASRLGWTVGITAKDLVGAQCAVVIGLQPADKDCSRVKRWPACGTRRWRIPRPISMRWTSCRTAATPQWRSRC